MFYQIYKEILIRQRRYLQIISKYLWRSRVASGLHQGSKKRGTKGEGRAVIYKPVQLPVDLIEDLKLYKDAYGMLLAEEEDEWGNPIPVHVSYEQMFRRWMDNVKKMDIYEASSSIHLPHTRDSVCGGHEADFF